MKNAPIAALLLALLALFASESFGRPAPDSTSKQPVEIFQGGILELTIPAAGLTAVEGRMGKAMIPFLASGNDSYTGLVGADLEAKPGPVTMVVKATTLSGARRDSQIFLRIKAKSFKQESFSVAKEFDQLGPEALERIRQDQAQFSRAFVTSAPERLWDGHFISPISSEVSSPFGYRRVVNGIPRAPHTGVDLRAPMGSEVLATNHGRVVLLGDFFFSGYSVVLDHGAGLYTMYFHLSEFKVEMGSIVRKGDVIGLSGMSGRVTGPHLHWGARLNGARVDPFELLHNVGHAEGNLGLAPP